MDDHKKKMIAPIVVTVILVLYYILYFAVLAALIPTVAIKVVLAIVPLLFGGVMIKVCIQRIKEIRSGEEDDLSKY